MLADAKRQTMEIAAGLQLVVDKGLDLESNACIAQCDIRKYFDSMRMDLIAEWFLEHGMCKMDVTAFVHHQMFSNVLIACDGAKVQPKISFRGVRGLTGSRTAGALARLPVLDLVQKHHAKWCKLGFQGSISIATWIDNLYTAGDTPHKAVSILIEAE